MQKLLVVTIILLTTGLTCCDKRSAQDEASDISKIKALSAARTKAFNEGSAEVIAAAFTESRMLMAPDKRSTTNLKR